MPYKDAATRKEHSKSYNEAYHAQNKERILQKKKSYYAENKERIQAQRKAYQEANKERIQELRKAYEEQHAHEIAEWKKAYRASHRQVEIERRWTVEYRHKALVTAAKKRSITVDISFHEYADIIRGGLCHYCGGTLNKCGGGLDRKNNEPYYRIDNVVPCCQRCNTTFMDHFDYEEKLIIAKAIKEVDQLRLSRSPNTSS